MMMRKLHATGAALGVLAGAFLCTSASAQSDPRTPAVLAAVRAGIGGDLGADARFAIAFGDLNDDHQPEAIVHLADRAYCGSGGCTTVVLTNAADGWHVIGKVPVSRLPVYRLPDNHNGWFDLAVYTSGGGAQPGLRTVRFGKGRYASTGQAIGRLPQQASPLLPATSEFIGVDAH
jgi:hypothetical protein